MKSVRTVAMYFPEASASRYEYTSNSPLNFAEFQELVINETFSNSKHPIKYPFSLLYFHCTFAFAILHELLTYFHYDTRTI